MYDSVAMLGCATRSCPAADRRAAVRLAAGGVHPLGADAERDRQQGEAARPPALCRGQGDPRRAARERGEELPLAGHLHVLRHRQLEPDDHGADGAAHARGGLRQSGHAAAPGADPRRGAPAGGDRPATATTTARSRNASTRRRWSTPLSACWRPVARPTMRFISPRSRARRESCSTGTTSRS
jgi:hypothetical protein